jgi:hypothetical protein
MNSQLVSTKVSAVKFNCLPDGIFITKFNEAKSFKLVRVFVAGEATAFHFQRGKDLINVTLDGSKRQIAHKYCQLFLIIVPSIPITTSVVTISKATTIRVESRLIKEWSLSTAARAATTLSVIESTGH